MCGSRASRVCFHFHLRVFSRAGRGVRAVGGGGVSSPAQISSAQRRTAHSLVAVSVVEGHTALRKCVHLPSRAKETGEGKQTRNGACLLQQLAAARWSSPRTTDCRPRVRCASESQHHQHPPATTTRLQTTAPLPPPPARTLAIDPAADIWHARLCEAPGLRQREGRIQVWLSNARPSAGGAVSNARPSQVSTHKSAVRNEMCLLYPRLIDACHRHPRQNRGTLSAAKSAAHRGAPAEQVLRWAAPRARIDRRRGCQSCDVPSSWGASHQK